MTKIVLYKAKVNGVKPLIHPKWLRAKITRRKKPIHTLKQYNLTFCRANSDTVSAAYAELQLLQVLLASSGHAVTALLSSKKCRKYTKNTKYSDVKIRNLISWRNMTIVRHQRNSGYVAIPIDPGHDFCIVPGRIQNNSTYRNYHSHYCRSTTSSKVICVLDPRMHIRSDSVVDCFQNESDRTWFRKYYPIRSLIRNTVSNQVFWCSEHQN